ncbi:hypothetical protein [Bacillus sp. 1P06AnD]|uniref:hypothetical protein n=1 Tax=Bacillus sp. 1P06AnD TaxID=3132208 RepID=UPI0039A290D3
MAKASEVININYKNRKDSQKEKIKNWLAAQSNATQSILSLIEHSIDRYGYTDVEDHEVRRKMYLEIVTFNSSGSPTVPHQMETVATANSTNQSSDMDNGIVKEKIEEEQKQDIIVSEQKNNEPAPTQEDSQGKSKLKLDGTTLSDY